MPVFFMGNHCGFLYQMLWMVSQISKISLSDSRASQASLCSSSTVDWIANLLPSEQIRAMLRLA